MLLDSAGPPGARAGRRRPAGVRGNRQARLTKPAGALGRLEELSIWLAGVRGACPPPLASPDPGRRLRRRPRRRRRPASRPTRARSPPRWWPTSCAGGAAVNVLAGSGRRDRPRRRPGRRHRRRGRAGRDHPAQGAPQLRAHRPRGRPHAATRRAGRSLAGQAIADEEIDGGADLLIAGDMGIGNTTPATVLIALLTGTRAAHARRPRHRHRRRRLDPQDQGRTRRGPPRPAVPRATRSRLVGVVGGADIAAMAGFLVRGRRAPYPGGARRRRRPARLRCVADRMTPGRRGWWRGRSPLDRAGARRGAGRARARRRCSTSACGSARAPARCWPYPCCSAAAATLADMATFDEAGVSDHAAHRAEPRGLAGGCDSP